jgi:hypothetical protein
MNKDWAAQQREVCERSKSRFVPISPEARIGIALNTMARRPLNGLRHPPHGDMAGWYIWGGEYSPDANFFQVLHAKHFPTEYPELVKFLGLEPGFRFLTDGNIEDIWFDGQLLNITDSVSGIP